MTRGTQRSDRFVTALVGLGLLALGGLAIVWSLELVPAFDADQVALTGADGWTDAAWWPWVLLVGGAALTLAALLWCLGHGRRAGLRAVALEGSGPEGRLRVRLDAIASAVAASASERIAVESASGSTGHGSEAGLVEVSVKSRHDASLEEIRRDLAEVDAEVATPTAGAVPVRYRVTAAKPPRAAATN